MVITWVCVAALAEVSGAAANQASQIVVSVPGAAMTCTREGDHFVCVLPLDEEALGESLPAAAAAAKARPYKPSPPTPALPNPEALTQLKVAKANIELAKSLLPKATTPEETVLVEQLLYRAKEQYRTARALLHTVHADLRGAADPFEGDKSESDAHSMAICEAGLVDACDTPAYEDW